ncbi:ubiquitin-like small modifier protein 1 [Phycisphaerales bacterium AB-hyl4]|uniref:Ubiquitin-like small modifier protein 1 n=1 Tax=Natronomicrosphaera hydrolytica TaxID=3242702 RepID=A0ABV4U4B4_9BACT
MPDTVKIHIPTALRPQVGDQESVDVPANTVGEALGTLKNQYPDFGKKLYKTDDQLNRFINVYLNDEDIRFLDNLDTELKAGDEVSIVPAIAGG